MFPSLGPVSGDAEPKVRYYGMTVCTSRSTTSFFLRIFLYVYVAQICSERTLKPSAYNFVFFFFFLSLLGLLLPPFKDLNGVLTRFLGQFYFYKLP